MSNFGLVSICGFWGIVFLIPNILLYKRLVHNDDFTYTVVWLGSWLFQAFGYYLLWVITASQFSTSDEYFRFVNENLYPGHLLRNIVNTFWIAVFVLVNLILLKRIAYERMLDRKISNKPSGTLIWLWVASLLLQILACAFIWMMSILVISPYL